MNITLIYNPKSGSALPLSELKKKFRSHGIKITKAIAINSDFKKNITKAAKRPGVIAVIGGDGSISGAANFVVNTKATLAPLPGGTLNHFTKDLGIPQDLDKAIGRLRTAKAKQIDVAEVNKTIFINNSSIGLYPNSLKTREDREDTLGKWPAAAFALLRAFIVFRTYSVTLNNRSSILTPFIFVGNNPYKISDFGATDRTKINTGTLSVYLVKTKKRLGLVKLFFSALIGQLHDADEFETMTTTKLVVETKKRRLHVSHDGEVSKLSSPLRFEIKPRALKIL